MASIVAQDVPFTKEGGSFTTFESTINKQLRDRDLGTTEDPERCRTIGLISGHLRFTEKKY